MESGFMTNRIGVKPSYVLVACLLGSPVCLSSERAENYTLTTAVPGDVFYAVGHRQTPGASFIDEYWFEVTKALADSGIAMDVFDLLTSKFSPSEADDVNALRARATKLISAINWRELGKKEFVFAQRFPRATATSKRVVMGPPDMLWAFRGNRESAAKNYKGLTALARAIVEEVNTRSGRTILRFDDAPSESSQCCALQVVRPGDSKSPFSLGVGLHNDVVVVAVGEEMLTDVMSLLRNQGSKSSLANVPRFDSAFADLPAQGNEFSYLDLRILLGSMKSVFDGIIVASGHTLGGDRFVNALIDQRSVMLNDRAIAAYKRGNYQRALEIIEKAHEAVPQDSLVMYNLSCFHALGGNKEESLKWLQKAVDGGFYAPGQISTDTDLKLIRTTERYDKALAKAKRKAQEGAWPKKAVNRLMSAVGIVDRVATVTYVKGYSKHSESLAWLSANAKSSPFYAVIDGRPEQEHFERFLPVETVSFSLTSGVNLDKLYEFIERSFLTAGWDGQRVWKEWTEAQRSAGFDLRDDVLSWIQGTGLSIAIDRGTGHEAVFMLKVNDERVARKKLDRFLQFAVGSLRNLATKNPAVSMFSLRLEPSTHERLKGFHRLQLTMIPKVFVCGVKDGYLVVGTSEEAVALCFATAAGDHPNVTKNKQLMAEIVQPTGPFTLMSFNDQRHFGEELEAMIQGVSFGAGMAVSFVPNPKAKMTIGRVLGLVAKLGPVARKIDFHKSASTLTTMDGDRWRTRSVTHFKSPSERLDSHSKL